MKMNARDFVLALALLVLPGGVEAQPTDFPTLPKPVPGIGTYVMVLLPPGTPDPNDPKKSLTLPEPDIKKLGGRLVFSSDNRRVITLPLGIAKQLRRDNVVVYLQRIWNGESLDGWDERYSSGLLSRSSNALRPRPEADTGLTWGPKAYSYDGSGNITQMGTDSYTYDSAGRLIQATVYDKATATAHTESFKYDSFGNLIEKQVTGANANSIPVDGNSNRLIGVTYDAAGNALTAQEGRRTYSYDSFNMMTRVRPIAGYDRRMLYDANDEQIGMMVVGDTLSRWMIRDFDGNIIREYKGDNMFIFYWEEDSFYGEGTLVGGETQDWSWTSSFHYGGKRHYHLDHLGSVRVVTDNTARSISEHDYYPFGTTITRTFQEQINWGDLQVDGRRFAGHWRDFLGLINVDNTEYIDNMHARRYDPTLGRFLSVDPARDANIAVTHPQSWNRFVYGRNNPIANVDPDGRVVIGFTGFISANEDSQIRALMTRLDNAGGLGTARAFDSDGRSEALEFVEMALRVDPDQPVVIMGHSWGADSAFRLAAALGQKGIHVNALITIDPIGKTGGEGFFRSPNEAWTVPSNVRMAVNYFQRSDLPLMGNLIKASAPSTSVANILVKPPITHKTMDEVASKSILQLLLQGLLLPPAGACISGTPTCR
jgi:RHS repeat-associated protein